jgi:hypothetical protein
MQLAERILPRRNSFNRQAALLARTAAGIAQLHANSYALY